MSEMTSATLQQTKFGLHRSIAGRLLIWFLLISLVPCAVITTLTVRSASHALEDSVHDKLSQIAASKAVELETYCRERLADVTLLARDPDFINAASTFTSTQAQLSVKQTDRFLAEAAESAGFLEMFVIDPKGKILFSANPNFTNEDSILNGALASTQLAAGFERSRTLLQSQLSGFQMYASNPNPLAFLISPILKDGRVIAVLAGGIGPERVWRILADMSGLGNTGEIVVGEIIGDELLITAPLRSDPNSAFRRKLSLVDNLAKGYLGATQVIPVAMGASGNRGYGIVSDYRGIEVAASWCYLPSFRWGMNVKQDASEAFALLYFQRNAIIGLSIAIIVCVTITALLVARSISNPIRTASRVARQVASGDLRANVGLTSNDETGALLVAIQTMTNDLRGLIGRIQVSSVTLNGTATVIQTTSNNQQQIVAEYGAATNEAVAAVKEITGTSHELSKTMTEVNALASSTGIKAAEGRTDLQGMDSTMRTLETSTASIGTKLTTISEKASNINMVITTMVKVADQTNILSINAAIEAEKAGDYGLGFLVVAREISRLADQTAHASLDIERMVKEMQSSVTSGVKEMKVFTEQVQGGVREIGTLSEKLGEIISAVEGITGRFGLVTEGMYAQSQGAEQIRDAMVRLVDGAARTAESLNDSNRATVELRGAVAELKEEVSRFTT
ncbi:MAG: methyl-accepting chemotaxis protein [Phycisphaerales bacterium]